MALPIGISKLRFPGNGVLDGPITVSLYYRDYYDTGAPFTLIQLGVNVNADGTINESPLPSVTIDPGERYVLRAVNEFCGKVYDQPLLVNAYCPVNYTMSEDQSYCYIEDITEATPPSNQLMTTAATHFGYTRCGTIILDPGFNVDGTGPGTLIDFSNAYWRNASAQCVADGNTSDGPLNRCGLWATGGSPNPSQIGYSVCVTITESKVYYVGLGADDFASIRLDGNTILEQDPVALGVQYSGSGIPFIYWFIYPVYIEAGTHVLEVLGTDTGVAATLGAQIYDNTPAELAAATSDGDLTFVFNSADYIGMPVQIGSDGSGWSCPTGYALSLCESPAVCRRLLTIPVNISY